MVWQSPKTNWKATDKPIAADFNRIEGNIDAIKDDIDAKKGPIVSAINAMNQTAAMEDSFATLASKIQSISDDADATAAQVLTPKTFYQGGIKRTGTMPNIGTIPTKYLETNYEQYTIPRGYHSGSGKVIAALPELNKVSVPDFWDIMPEISYSSDNNVTKPYAFTLPLAARDKTVVLAVLAVSVEGVNTVGNATGTILFSEVFTSNMHYYSEVQHARPEEYRHATVEVLSFSTLASQMTLNVRHEVHSETGSWTVKFGGWYLDLFVL